MAYRPTRFSEAVGKCRGVGNRSKGRGNGSVVGRLDRQGTRLCRLLWDVDEAGKRPFETGFRLLGLSGATVETLCSCVLWLHGLCDGRALDKGIGRCSGKAFRMSFLSVRAFLSRACHHEFDRYKSNEIQSNVVFIASRFRPGFPRLSFVPWLAQSSF